jgi:hypothetical protein
VRATGTVFKSCIRTRRLLPSFIPFLDLVDAQSDDDSDDGKSAKDFAHDRAS